LHLESKQIEAKNNVPQTPGENGHGVNAPTENLSIAAHTIKSGQNYKQVLLSTAVIQVFDKNGKPVMCRVLLDSGSQKLVVYFIDDDIYDGRVPLIADLYA